MGAVDQDADFMRVALREAEVAFTEEEARWALCSLLTEKS